MKLYMENYELDPLFFKKKKLGASSGTGNTK